MRSTKSEIINLNFAIKSTEVISGMFLEINISNFNQAINYVRMIPYGRNINKNDLTIVLTDNCGTCSTKHALLKQLAIENNFTDIKLIIGLFKMNTKNTPEISDTLLKYGLEYIPEAHCYLHFAEKIIDCTKQNSNDSDFVNDLIKETEISPNQITDYKVEYHKKYLQDWLRENHQIKFTLNEIWNIREQCIQDLADGS